MGGSCAGGRCWLAPCVFIWLLLASLGGSPAFSSFHPVTRLSKLHGNQLVYTHMLSVYTVVSVVAESSLMFASVLGGERVIQSTA